MMILRTFKPIARGSVQEASAPNS